MRKTRSMQTRRTRNAGKTENRVRWAWWSMAAAAVVFGASLSLVAQGGQARRPAVAGAGQGGGINGIGSSEVGADFSPKEPVKPLSPKEEQARFILPPGYHLELVMSEPQIISPGAIAFDGDGRMFVAELRSYMLDADATAEKERTSRISMHESTKGDGVYDRHTVFVDNVSTPRFVTPLDGNAILTMETDTDEIYRYTDTDGDGVADKKELFYKGAGRIGQNLEHQPSGFIWAMDNWIYSTYNAFRLRWTPKGEVLKETTAPNGGQWGLTQDDYGKVWFVDAGGERGPVNFQTPIQYGAFNVDDQFEDDFRVVWPAYMGGHADTQGGMGRVRMPVGVLNHFTATCGQDIFRGHGLPDDLRGDLLFAEPVGRLVRRAKVSVSQGLTRLENAYPGSEFITSTDPLFRPVNMTTAPDGTIYLSDMYHGIIQESNWTRKGSYLRKKIEQYGFDKVINHGRIWRLVHDSKKPDYTKPRMQSATPAQLVGYLSHPNGWWRDTRAAHAGAAPGRVGGAGAAGAGAGPAAAWSAASTRCGRSKGSASSTPATGPRADEGRQPADARPGDPRQRVADQGRRQDDRGRRPRARQGRRRQRRHPGAADAEPAEGAGHRQAGRGRAGGDQGARRQGARRPDAAAAAVRPAGAAASA